MTQQQKLKLFEIFKSKNKTDVEFAFELLKNNFEQFSSQELYQISEWTKQSVAWVDMFEHHSDNWFRFIRSAINKNYDQTTKEEITSNDGI